MKAVKPLSELLKQADEFTKVASPSVASRPAETAPVDAMASLLLSATEPVELDKVASEQPAEAEFEKLAEAFCRLHVAAVLDDASRVAAFEKKAAAEGYTPEQIDEALSKVAAEKTVKNLPLLTALSAAIGTGGKDVNALAPKKQGFSRMLGNYDLTKNVGY